MCTVLFAQTPPPLQVSSSSPKTQTPSGSDTEAASGTVDAEAGLNALDAQVQHLLTKAEAADASGTATVLGDLSERIKEDRWMLRA